MKSTLAHNFKPDIGKLRANKESQVSGKWDYR
jgi:hypothetical protein